MGCFPPSYEGIPQRIALTAVLLVAMAWVGGCRGNAYRDAYNEKMAGEIRLLEDQLYKADYENKTLRNQLRRARDQQPSSPPDAASGPQDRSQTGAGPQDRSPAGSPDPSGSDGSSDRFDARLLPPPSGIPREDDDRAVDQRRIEVPGETPPKGDGDSDLVPPRLDDLEMPEIELGTPSPPQSSTGTPELPPNQIPKTDAQRQLEESVLPPPQPAALAIHPGFSGAHQFDDESSSQGIYLVLHFVDEQGRTLDMRGTEIDADLTVTIIDPASDREAPEIGQWEYSAEQVAELRRSSPFDSLHVAIPWPEESAPVGEQVTAVVRLANGAERLEGEAEVLLQNPASVAGWRKAPRLRE
jgi:hypothetical protein